MFTRLTHFRVLSSFASRGTVGRGQYRNAAASGRRCASLTKQYCSCETHPTLPRYGTDLVQPRIQIFEAKPVYLNASSGSTFAARRAGTIQATRTTIASTTATATNVTTSIGFTPKSNVVI